MLVFLLLVGFAAMGFWFDRQSHPISEQGLPRREGWLREVGLGLATGWGVALVCVLPLTLFGGIAISFYTQSSAWGWLVADAAFFALLALAEEIAYRGYAFQCFIRALGPTGATLGFAVIYAIIQALTLGANRASFVVSLAFSLVAFHGLLAHARAVGELGTQLCMEGEPRAGLRTCGERRQQPFAGGAGRSHGTFLAYGRSIRTRRQLAGAVCSSGCDSGCFSRYARSGLSL